MKVSFLSFEVLGDVGSFYLNVVLEMDALIGIYKAVYSLAVFQLCRVVCAGLVVYNRQ